MSVRGQGVLWIFALVCLFIFGWWFAGELNDADARPSNGPACEGHLHTAKRHRWVLNLRGSETIPKWAQEKHGHAVRCAASPGHRQAMQNQWRRVQRSLLPPNHDLWVRIGRCEQPGSGYKGVNWSHPGPTYQGGLGIWYGNWDALKPKGYPADAGQATWRQQMIVANKLAGIYGVSAWGCA